MRVHGDDKRRVWRKLHLTVDVETKIFPAVRLTSNSATDAVIAADMITTKKRLMHFHCRLGQGRTTMALALYDMIVNAHQVSFDDIIKLQYLLGGYNLDDEYSERINFLMMFYTSIKAL